MSALGDLLHKIVDVAAGDGKRQDLHEEIDGLDEPGGSAEAAPEPPSEAEPAEEAALEPSEPVPAPEPAPDLPTAEELAAFREWQASQAQPVSEPVDDGSQVQEHVQEDGSAEADA